VLKTFFQKALGPVKTIGLGDGLNDVALLREVDYPVLVRQADGGYEEGVRVENLMLADGIGPRGWNKAVLEIIEG
jgi:mannosyl-3-phosphoglycerate phosphatase